MIVGSVADDIDRFERDIAPTHYLNQSKSGQDDRELVYKNLKAFFGRMLPNALKTVHDYQYLDARATQGAPARANKELAYMSTICHQFVKWELIDRNPFTNMKFNRIESDVRVVTRRQILRFYLWSPGQRQNYRTLGCAAMFCYLTGFRASEVRPFLKTGLSAEGVKALGAKRKKGEAPVWKLRQWSPRLRCVVARAVDREDGARRTYLFAPSKRSQCHTRSGWGASWQDAMNAWIRSVDSTIKEDQLVTSPPFTSPCRTCGRPRSHRSWRAVHWMHMTSLRTRTLRQRIRIATGAGVKTASATE